MAVVLWPKRRSTPYSRNGGSSVSSYREGILRAIGNLGADIEAKLLSLSPEEQTKLSWAKTIKSFDQVPAVYKDSARFTDELKHLYNCIG
jgi:hypothetical protein